MTNEETARRGLNAQREWSELEAAFDRVHVAIVRNLIETPPTMPEKVMKLHMAAQNLAAVQKAILDVINNGTLAQVALASQGLTRPN